MMNHWYDSMGAGGWLLMSVLWVALIALIVWAIANLFPRAGRDTANLAERPEEILDRRLALGEIDPATYDALRGKLHEAHRHVPTDGFRRRRRPPRRRDDHPLDHPPSAMQLLGRWNWYLPSWLSWLPRLDAEGSPTPTGDRRPKLELTR